MDLMLGDLEEDIDVFGLQDGCEKDRERIDRLILFDFHGTNFVGRGAAGNQDTGLFHLLQSDCR